MQPPHPERRDLLHVRRLRNLFCSRSRGCPITPVGPSLLDEAPDFLAALDHPGAVGFGTIYPMIPGFVPAYVGWQGSKRLAPDKR